jgi:hypothetical protein
MFDSMEANRTPKAARGSPFPGEVERRITIRGVLMSSGRGLYTKHRSQATATATRHPIHRPKTSSSHETK